MKSTHKRAGIHNIRDTLHNTSAQHMQLYYSSFIDADISVSFESHYQRYSTRHTEKVNDTYTLAYCETRWILVESQQPSLIGSINTNRDDTEKERENENRRGREKEKEREWGVKERERGNEVAGCG